MPADAAPGFLWIAELPAAGAELTLEGDDAHYVARVCRATPGQTVTATDGRGALAHLELLAVRGEVRARVQSLSRARDAGGATVACGAPEGARADWLVEKLGELGVRVFQPLEAERAGWERFDGRRERLERLAEAALRQSRQAWRLEIGTPRTLADWLGGLPSGGARWLADPAGAPAAGLLLAGPAIAAIGPSEGFTSGEVEALETAGFAPVRLAPGRLRTETAAVGWAALWAAAQPAAETSA